jgi:hypothetical protein
MKQLRPLIYRPKMFWRVGISYYEQKSVITATFQSINLQGFRENDQAP